MKLFNWLFGKKKEKGLVLDPQSYEMKKLELDREVLAYERDAHERILDIDKEYGTALESRLERRKDLELSIVKLDAEEDARRAKYETHWQDLNSQLNAKDREIDRLKSIIDQMIIKFPKVEVLNKVAA